MIHKITFTKNDIIAIVQRHVQGLGLKIDEDSIKYKGSASLEVTVTQVEEASPVEEKLPQPKGTLETLPTELPVEVLDPTEVSKSTFLTPVDTDRSTKGLKTIEPPDTFEDSLVRARMNRPAPFSADKVRK